MFCASSIFQRLLHNSELLLQRLQWYGDQHSPVARRRSGQSTCLQGSILHARPEEWRLLVQHAAILIATMQVLATLKAKRLKTPSDLILLQPPHSTDAATRSGERLDNVRDIRPDRQAVYLSHLTSTETKFLWHYQKTTSVSMDKQQ